jgi:hypothetical protein
VASDFLKKRMEDSYLAEIHRIEEEKYLKIEEEKRKYDILTPEQKEQRLLDGLYNYHWSSFSADDSTIGHS